MPPVIGGKLRGAVLSKVAGGRFWKQEGSLGVGMVGHRAYIGGRWEEYGQLEFNYLVEHGLKPESVLLDIACGSLRAGVHFIPYLDAGNYLGIEKESSLIKQALAKELAPEIRDAKRPELVISADFEFDKFSKQADFSLAWSLFTHLNVADLEKCLRNLRSYAPVGHQLFGTFLPGTSDENASNSHAHAAFYYAPDVMTEMGERLGFECDYLGEIDPSRDMKMHMMRFIAR
jgi:SAM-dependent methyltransferase